MPRRENLVSWVSLTLAALVTAHSALAQSGAAPAPSAAPSAAPAAAGTPQFTGGTVFDVKGDVAIMHGARTSAAARGTSVQPGDRVFMQPDAILLIRCPEADVQRITTPGSFTFSGCQPAAVAAARPATTPEPGAPSTAASAPAAGTGGSTATVASTSVPPATTTPPVTGEVVRRSGGMGGGTLGVLGGLLLLGAAAGGGGGGGGGSSGSTSPPVSP